MQHNSLTFVLFAVIISSLTVPAFADSYTDKFPNCATLDGFVSDVDDSTGLAKECLDMVHDSNIKPGELTLAEITQYCKQYRADADLEKDCIINYKTVEDKKSTEQIILISMSLIGSGIIIAFVGTYFSDKISNSVRMWGKILQFVGYAIMILAIVVLVGSAFIPESVPNHA